MKTLKTLRQEPARFWNPILLNALGVWLATLAAQAGQTNFVAAFALKDQYDKMHSVTFPSEKVKVLTIADSEGSKQLPAWVEPIHKKFGERIEIHGLADVAGVPRWLRAMIASQFRKKYQRPVMLDWDGQTVTRCGYERKQALVLVVDRAGEIRHRVTGAADAKKLDEVFAAIDEAKP